ncbi:hypothetical protein AYY26_10465 [Photobacterium phosphoreum]|uniref:hypothetical protein n=1 Tax=Photobacterium phosphoreum TaxID=659 RepID=UPI0007F9780C|nr:hypothetical protein [Photobacterium phosphoreum]OBU36291.1 hypothetical protein AYY26_10465 [Photobacterium phosphoreum]
MNKHQQSGMTTLLITSMLLIVALLFSLASYKNLFYQIKRTQNEVLARQAHWAAEGGLECGYSKIFIDRDLSKLDSNLYPDYLYHDCVAILGLDKIVINMISGNKKYRISSEYNLIASSQLSKVIDLSPNLSSGTIKSTADVFIFGSATFFPPDPGEETDEGWECKVARFKRYFVIDKTGSINNSGVGPSIESPYVGFNPNGKDCLVTHQSTSVTNLLQDFEQDSTIDPFYEFFSVDKRNWETVRDSTHYQFGIINSESVENKIGSKILVNRVIDCGNKIATQISTYNKVNIWVNGSCEIDSTGLTKIATASKNVTNGVLILVHNGVLSINGSGDIKGVLFHFNQPTIFSPEKKDWEGLIAFDTLGTTPTVFNNMLDNTYLSGSVPLATDAAYFQNGAFNFSGGQYYDLDGQMVFFYSALNLIYNRDYIERSMGAGEPKWQQGSWHDF